MAQLVYATLEPNYHNDDGVATVLYFDGEPTEAEVKQACRDLRGKVAYCDPDDEFFDYEERSTPVSERAGLRRYPCYGSG